MTVGYAGKNKVIIDGYTLHNIYDASTIFTAANLATDIFTLTGATGKVAKVQHISLTGIQTTASIITVCLVKRSTANTGGTSTTLTAIPIDSVNDAASCVVRAYTANPTTGTIIGHIQCDKVFVPDAATNKGTDASAFLGNESNGTPIAVIRDGEVLAISLEGATIAGNSFACHVRWEEVNA